MAVASVQSKYRIKEPKGLSPRITWLRDYFFKGVDRPWNNEYTAWTTGEPWDLQYNELTYYIVPETYPFLQTFRASLSQAARKVNLLNDFWKMSLPERRAWFNREVVVNYLPQEILPGDLLAGSRFNIHTSMCHTEKEAKARDKKIMSKNGARARMKWFHDHGYGNAGATSGHLVPGYEHVLKVGWKGVHADLETKYNALSVKEKSGSKGAQLRAMMTAATMSRDLAAKYSALCTKLADAEKDFTRKKELNTMAQNLRHVPWEPAEDFWQAMQALWLNHMLVMSDENYPGPGVSFGNFDRILAPYWEKSIAEGMDREFGKEIMKCMWVHANTAYDGMIRTGGNQGITAGFGQLITLSGLGPGGKDMTSDITWAILEVIDEMTPILEPKPNVRLHRNTPEELLDRVVDMIETSQGAPFLLNFDERSMAGLMLEGKKGGNFSSYQ